MTEPERLILSKILDPELREAARELLQVMIHKTWKEAEEKPEPVSGDYRVDKWPNSRFCAAYKGNDLLAVTVYRKGAEAITRRESAMERRIQELEATLGTGAPQP